MGAPRATYRVQFQPGFGFDQAAAIAGYLAGLGVSHLYSSPVLQAAPGSTHGYDVVDPSRVNQELGGEAAHMRLCHALGDAGLGQVLDIVPNHMAITPENAWWWDVLEDGPSSLYASYFDVDWDPPESRLRNTVLMPILGDHYGRVLEAGELELVRDGAAFTIRYSDQSLPVAPRSLDTVLSPAADHLGSDLLEFICSSYSRLPGSDATDLYSVNRRHRDKEVLRGLLSDLLAADPRTGPAIDEVVSEINADPDRLDALLERQNYRLARWRTAGWELSYRRFFDIASLVALRVEAEHVFAATHDLVLRWVREGVVDGLRVDHPDGLRDPEGYFRRLRGRSGEAWIVAEKILQAGERLPQEWAVDGTTGYDFLSRVGGLFVDPAGEEPLTRLLADFTGESRDFGEIVYEKKHLVMEELLAPDLNRLTELFTEVCERHRRQRDYTRPELNRALREVIACLPVYRTYASPARNQVSQADREHVASAVAAARSRAPEVEPELLDFLRDLLLLRHRGAREDELVERFQETSGPVMAKGVEDTAFYSYLRLVSLNEVGGDPGRFGTDPADFHRACEEAQRDWPGSMLTTSTHDTKRSEDVRVRISLLSEIPERWAAAVTRWSAINQRHHRNGLPDAGAEYLLYQTLVGAHPLETERAVEYMEKASKEAKLHTSWTHPDAEYDAALRRFVEAVAGDPEFKRELDEFVAPLLGPWRVAALAQKLITLTAPGVPDLYQGTELWDLSLVDPDNRRPVDYELRRRLLAGIEDLTPEAAMAGADQGLPKLYAVHRALHLRAARPDLFGEGSTYQALPACGAHAAGVVAFIRGGAAITAVPRLTINLAGWGDTSLDLPAGEWQDVLGGRRWSGRVAAADLFGRFPVALLVR